MAVFSAARRLAAVALLVCASGRMAPAASQPQLSERRVKAAFVSKFPQFVEWPDRVLAQRTAITICIASPDPFGADLQELVAGESVNGRAVVAHRLRPDESIERCHVLYLPAGVAQPLLDKAAALPILTVSDERRFLDRGGVIALHTESGRVRFDVSMAAARRAGLRLSSQLLELAFAIRGTRP